jgi:hypothetical protein
VALLCQLTPTVALYADPLNWILREGGHDSFYSSPEGLQIGLERIARHRHWTKKVWADLRELAEAERATRAQVSEWVYRLEECLGSSPRTRKWKEKGHGQQEDS